MPTRAIIVSLIISIERERGFEPLMSRTVELIESNT